MNLARLKIFRDLVDTKSFSKAALANLVTQSAVSQQIAALERRLKCRLVERGKRTFCLTPEGQKFYHGCKTLIESYDTLVAEIQEMSRQVTGGIKIATIYSIGLHELPIYVKEYMRQFPLVKIHVDYRRSNQVYEDVLQGTADFGLLAFPEKKPNLEVFSFRKDKLVLICHPRHKLAHFRAMPIQQIQGHPFVGFDPDMPTRKVLDKIFKKHKIEVKPVMEFDNIETLKRAVEIDMGVSLVPISTITQEIQNETLKVIEFTDVEIFRPLSIIYRKNRVLAPALKAFLSLLEKGIDEPKLTPPVEEEVPTSPNHPIQAETSTY